MKNLFVVSATFVAALSFAGAARAQANAVPQSAQGQPAPADNSAYGGMSASGMSAAGSTADRSSRAAWAQYNGCTYLPRCAPNSGH